MPAEVLGLPGLTKLSPPTLGPWQGIHLGEPSFNSKTVTLMAFLSAPRLIP